MIRSYVLPRVMLLMLVAASLACSTVTSAVESAKELGALASGQGTGGPSDALFTDPADPVDVTVALDASQAQLAVMTPEGGQMTVQDAAGNRFTLAIPAGALLVDTEITMTPVASIDDLPLTNGLVAAVQLGPDGLFLYADAILTIDPVDDVLVDNRILFGYLGLGKDLHLATPAAASDEIQIRVPHFSGFGLGSGIGTDRAALLLRRAADHEVRIRQEVAEYLVREQEAQRAGVPGPGLAGLKNYADSYYGLVVRPRMLAAGSSCTNGRQAIQAVLGFEREMQLLGLGEPGLIQDFLDVMKTVHDKCREEVIKECKAKVDPTILMQFDLGYARQQQLLGVGDGTLLSAIVEDAFKTCGAAFTASGQGGEVFIAGKICRLDEPFVLEITGDGATGSMHFAPETLMGGKFTDEFSGSGFSQSGGGTYKVNLLQEGATLEGSGEGCVTGSGFNSCGPGTFQAKLTLIKGGC